MNILLYWFIYMKLDSALNIDIVDEKPPETEPEPDINKDELLSDVPLDDDALSEAEIDLGLEFVAKPKPDTDDIFDDKIDEVIKEVKKEAPIPQVKVVKEEPPKKKKRKPMTEEHKAKLAISREKAIAKRKFLSEQKKIEKAQAQLVKDQEQLLRQKELDKKIKDLKLKADSLQDNEPVIPEKKQVTSQKSFTMEDIQNAQLNAIMGYEAVRKKRKAEKKAKQQENKAKEDILKTIKTAQPSWYVADSPFNGIF